MGEENIIFCCPIGFGQCALCQLEKKVWSDEKDTYHICFSYLPPFLRQKAFANLRVVGVKINSLLYFRGRILCTGHEKKWKRNKKDSWPDEHLLRFY